MSKSSLARSLLRHSKNRVSLISAACSNPSISHPASNHQFNTEHSSYHTTTLSKVLSAPLKSSPHSGSDFRSLPRIPHASIPCAKLSTLEVSDAEAGSSPLNATSEDSESVEDSDANPTLDFSDESLIKPPKSIVSGRASAQGTARYTEKFLDKVGVGHFRKFKGGDDELHVSSVGLGTYLGTSRIRSGYNFKKLIEICLEKGVNIFDTSTTHLDNFGERVIGNTIAASIKSGTIQRDEVVICTKGGIIPRDPKTHFNSREKVVTFEEDYLKERFISKGLFELSDISGKHCLAPAFIKSQVDLSLKNLGLECIDFYYLQNIEIHMDNLEDKSIFYDRIKQAFSVLEKECASGRIGFYGISSRPENFATPDSENFISLEKIYQQAKEIAGDGHHFRLVQMPFNLSTLSASEIKSQSVDDGAATSLLDAALQLGLNFVASSSNFNSRPYKGLIEKLGVDTSKVSDLSEKSQVLQYSRAYPGLLTALVAERGTNILSDLLDVVPRDCE